MIRIEPGDCLAVIPRLVAEGVQVDAIVTDPPYGLEFMGKEWDGADGFRRSLNAADAGRDNVFGRTSQTSPEYRTGWQNGGGFTKPGIGERETAWPSFSATSPFGAANPTCGTCGGRARGKKKCSCAEPAWKAIGKRRNPENEGRPDDVTSTGARQHLHIYQEWTEAWARAAFAILKPGGHLLAFGGTRTYHRMATAIEDAGFEIRDAIMWHYGSGFPKSLNVSKAIDKAARGVPQGGADPTFGAGHGQFMAKGKPVRRIRPGADQGKDGSWEKLTDRTYQPHDYIAGSSEAAEWEGWGTALKPATEIICVARKPLSERTVAANVLKHGTGAINIDECRIPTEGTRPALSNELSASGLTGTGGAVTYGSYAVRGSVAVGETEVGRFPANLAHDGSPEVMALFPYSTSGDSTALHAAPYDGLGGGSAFATPQRDKSYRQANEGSAARFFFSAKAQKSDRFGSLHPTVKPVKLIEWLITLVTRRGGLVLDCFAGSGTAGVAALATGRNAILIEREAAYVADIRARVAHHEGTGRHSASAKARNSVDKPGALL